jgi:hypothetical protein
MNLCQGGPYDLRYIHTRLRRDVLWYVESCISLTEKYTFT